jgi:hypothetical protein
VIAKSSQLEALLKEGEPLFIEVGCHVSPVKTYTLPRVSFCASTGG